MVECIITAMHLKMCVIIYQVDNTLYYVAGTSGGGGGGGGHGTEADRRLQGKENLGGDHVGNEKREKS